MNLSIFNFKGKISLGNLATNTKPLIMIALPIVTCTLLSVGLAQLWYNFDPSQKPLPDGRDTFESVLVWKQMERAKTAPAADIVITGDSSALMGINARVLENNLGKSVQSLATIGFVGPAGYGSILETYAQNAGKVKTVILQMAGHTFSDTEESNYEKFGYEKIVLTGSFTHDHPVIIGAREKLYTDFFARLIPMPLKGYYGEYYGWPENIVTLLDQDHGTMIDPTPLFPYTPRTLRRYQMSNDMRKRLVLFRKSLEKINPEQVLIAITPTMSGEFDLETQNSRNAILKEMLSILNLPESAILDTPQSLPDQLFCDNRVHFSAIGRNVYTKELTEVLRRRLIAKVESNSSTR